MDARTKKMQDKVAKLLRQAEDVAGTPEEAIFQAKAFELIAKYGLSLAGVEAAKDGLDLHIPEEATEWVVILEGKYQAQQAQLLYGIVKALHSTAVLSRGVNRTQKVHVFGMPRHIDRARMLWDILLPQMLRLVETVRPAGGFAPRLAFDYRTGEVRQKSTSGQLRQYRRAWIAGFAHTINERLTAQETKAIESAGSGALVLYRDDQARAHEALRAKYGNRVKPARHTRYDSAGYAHGQRDGRSAQLAHALAG